MLVGSLQLSVRLDGCRSLKEKRRARLSLSDRIRARWKIAVAEVADQDTWDLLTLGVGAVGADDAPVAQVLEDVARFVEHSGVGELIDDEVIVEKR
jgi:uncharacterized protein YlxP (DUF503 family)